MEKGIEIYLGLLWFAPYTKFQEDWRILNFRDYFRPKGAKILTYDFQILPWAPFIFLNVWFQVLLLK